MKPRNSLFTFLLLSSFSISLLIYGCLEEGTGLSTEAQTIFAPRRTYPEGPYGKEVGDIAEIQVPNGLMKFEIVDISR